MTALNEAQKKWLAQLSAMVGGRSAGPVTGDATATASSVTPAAAATAPVASPTLSASAEVLDDRRREFKRCRAQWVTVKKKAESDLELVKAGARKVYRADPEQFPKVVAGCKQIDTILDNLDDELRDTLDRYASTPLRAQAKLADLSSTASEVLRRYQRYVDSDPVMKAIDAKEFADVVVHAPVSKALRDLLRALA